MSRPPLLQGRLREEATARVREIATALARPYDDWTLSQRPGDTGLRTISLALGRCGVATFHAWLARTGLCEDAADRAARLLEESIEILPSQTMDASLLCGFPGVAWTTEHLLRLLGDVSEDDPNAEIDDAILAGLEDPTFHPAYDLIDGLAGHGVYALERRGRKAALPMLSLVLKRLEEIAVPQTVGLSWPSGLITRTAQGKDVQPDETYFNLGMSHGVPGVIGILARFLAVPELAGRVRPLLEGVTEWIVAQRLPAGMDGAYPDHVAPARTAEPARLAWCYGDPGVSAALFAAARALGRADLEAFALDVAHAAARRDFTTTGVVDDGICHGTAGVAHVFHRLYRATGDETCRRAGVAWFERLLTRDEERPNIAGFTTFCFERVREGEYIEDPAWLTGAAGVGLVLLSALTDLDPTWDRPLLLDLGA